MVDWFPIGADFNLLVPEIRLHLQPQYKAHFLKKKKRKKKSPQTQEPNSIFHYLRIVFPFSLGFIFPLRGKKIRFLPQNDVKPHTSEHPKERGRMKS